MKKIIASIIMTIAPICFAIWVFMAINDGFWAATKLMLIALGVVATIVAWVFFVEKMIDIDE